MTKDKKEIDKKYCAMLFSIPPVVHTACKGLASYIQLCKYDAACVAKCDGQLSMMQTREMTQMHWLEQQLLCHDSD